MPRLNPRPESRPARRALRLPVSRLASRLASRLRLVRRGGDEGGIAVLICVLLAGGVLLGMGALAVDVGQLYAEREELQSGADAAAVAVAELCARDGGRCGTAPSATAQRYADANAKDGTSGVELVCGRTGDGGLPACPPTSGNLAACIGEPPATAVYVETRTLSRQPGGETLLPPILAQTLLGRDGYAGAEVRACARAAWGPPLRTRGLGLTISLCEWREATAGGTAFAPAPPAVVTGAAERVLYLHTTTAKTCTTRGSGGDNPGGFGWLDDPDDNCSVLVEADGTYGGDPGASLSRQCERVLKDARDRRTLTYLPIFREVAGTGQNTRYTIEGFAPFVITGYALPGGSEPSELTGVSHCKGSDKCVYGYFTRALIPARGTIGGPDLGAAIVTLIG
ncbi:pilus assembly protein TadG-related protein [Planobispora rosea]|uniref:pilus assembly protein TadG-related protein n=1 Tax=Planobispora rosea TaxID=35762 RepID=UPI0009FD07E3|nr:pilus assembly protein TadG-related protein [Planobispora rosea]